MIAVAVDGPAGAGKSSISRRLAAKLGYIYVDTGALYRAVGLNALRRGVPTRDECALVEMLKTTDVDLAYVDGIQHIFLNGEDVSDAIRDEAVSMAASAVSSLAVVRAFLMDLQRGLAEKYNVIMDGRDIGTVVLPNAQVKIFLTASPEARAQRRYTELVNKGVDADYETVLADLKKRDHDDSTREVCPLKPAEDSVIIDTTGNTLIESIALLEKAITDRVK